MKITRIYRGKKSNRINVDLDEEFGFSVEEVTLVRFNLFVGKVFEKNEIAQIEKQDQTEYLYNKALDAIARRARSESELKDLLKKKSEKRFKKIDSEALEGVIERLKSQGHIDDEAFAKWFVGSRLKMQKHSIYHIRNELGLKFGVEKGLIERILGEAEVIDKELETIENLIEKKFGQYKNKHKDKRVAKEKMLQYLSNKGFSWDAVNKVLNK